MPTFCFTADEGAALEDGSWIVAEMTNDEANVSTALRALKSSDYRVRAAACLALKTLALTLAPSQQQGKAEMVTGRLTSMPLLSRGHIKVVPVMAGLLVKDDDPYVRMCAAEALGTIAAPGDALALDACQRAIKDRAWMVAEAATTALAKLVNKGEQTVTLMAERSRIQIRVHGQHRTGEDKDEGRGGGKGRRRAKDDAGAAGGAAQGGGECGCGGCSCRGT